MKPILLIEVGCAGLGYEAGVEHINNIVRDFKNMEEDYHVVITSQNENNDHDISVLNPIINVYLNNKEQIQEFFEAERKKNMDLIQMLQELSKPEANGQ